ncbi:nitrogen permease regulator 2-domain-containing protein [Clohesyomyces aquaticus]|uniref:Nitrogen permease regulator 2-domain-containing protein n=1 Tax=Clohesyomyces aquaticus TaxID=1231657 RepID=A0A1Y1ZVF6_9PLEO|nr:nitrogen permease regulator 2-domain-containing protein [Clohesyomyces aquaticus]
MPTRAIKAIFFTRFHHEKGSRVLHQVPEGSITPSSSPSALSTPLIPFSSITSYLIPTQQFCDRLLTFCTNHHRVIGYPVCIREGKYFRNEFIFNFAVVIEEGVGDWVAYGEVVRKMGKLLRGLEEQGGFVSGEEEGRGFWDGDPDGEVGVDGVGNGSAWDQGPVGGGSKVYALCEMIMEDLNNYCECMIPIDDSNTINLKLFPTHPPPPPIHSYQVPLLTISLSSLTSPISSDLTLTRVIPFINGIHSVSHIAQLADTDLSLTRKAIQHLVYYGCIVLLDIFSFGAVYAPTAEIGGFVTDAGVAEECARYVRVPRIELGRSSTTGTAGLKLGSGSTNTMDTESRDGGSLSSDSSSRTKSRGSVASPSVSVTSTDFDNHDRDQNHGHNHNQTHNQERSSAHSHHHASSSSKQEDDSDGRQISHDTLITLYTSLRQGLTLKNWVLENLDLLSGIDVRRLITFGIIKGFLYRVHRYAIATSTITAPIPGIGGGRVQEQSDGMGVQTQHPAGVMTPAEAAPGVIRAQTSQHQQQHKPSISTLAPLHPPPYPAPVTVPAYVSVSAAASALLDRNAISTPHPHTNPHPLPEALEPKSVEHELLSTPLIRFLDGMHCFDEMCMELGQGEKEVETKVRRVGEVGWFWR